jgi:IAA-amino acid hydrolase
VPAASGCASEGALEDPAVQRIFGLYVMPWIPTGEIASRAGTLLAATSALKIVMHGEGGHAAAPHMSVDPVVAAAKAVVEVQSLIARE